MKRELAEEPKNDADLISEMGRERMALRARNATVLLTAACSFVCLGAALAGFTGFVLSVTVAGRLRW
ncbi:hypothetical protein GBA63_07520 [Rubrobacter tropicus]|uniref:Transmembrane protein n=1 Tax=Rubrobacter tropicus TaxID=2653851 RepID=A0A6G8Q7Q4_9ACTN|nr:hypothetical protein [Rubrobacter tropicus]QIN82506.1 hypothetical protein GBA63_07520 [Rubrobacter tropicus]